jgi:hypothetical protein
VCSLFGIFCLPATRSSIFPGYESCQDRTSSLGKRPEEPGRREGWGFAGRNRYFGCLGSAFNINSARRSRKSRLSERLLIIPRSVAQKHWRFLNLNFPQTQTPFRNESCDGSSPMCDLHLLSMAVDQPCRWTSRMSALTRLGLRRALRKVASCR